MSRTRKPKALTWDAALRLAVEAQTAATRLEQDCKRLEEFVLRTVGGSENLHYVHLDCAAAASGAHAAELMLARVVEELGK